MDSIPSRIKNPLPAPTSCHLCGDAVELVHNSRIYYGESRGWPWAYRCRGCGSHVGCHPGTHVPLGTLANARMRRARQRAHEALDPMWKHAANPNKARDKAYAWLAGVLGVPLADCHIAMMDEDMCNRVVHEVLRRELKKALA